MKLFTGAVAVMLLAGCMAPTMNEARQKGPDKILYSKKSDKAVAQCLQYEWQNQSLFGVTPEATLQPGRDGGYTVFTAGSEYFVDVQPGASGAVAKYYAVLNNWISAKRLTALQSCL
ncbi:hypothetical protein ACYZT4_10545 [Pseudomonas sp. GB2N2]